MFVCLYYRLTSYDRNENFNNVIAVDIPLPVSVDWPQSGFHQLTPASISECPPVSQQLIRNYFILRTACDHQQSGDIQALRKGHLLVESKRVEACSLRSSDDKLYSFFTGIVKAAMKRKVAYNVKLKLDSGSGEILNSDCECPAGKGPHGTCKHIAAILQMLDIFVRTSSLLCRKSCTDTLQTFHQPRQLYDGSPVKISTILKRRRLPTKDAADDDDPRLKFRKWESYNNYVDTMVTAYCFKTGKDLAHRYLREKADIHSAMLDHDYLELPYGEYWVDAANSVTSNEVKTIEEETKKQSESTSWLSERLWRVTASRFGDVLKATDRRNMPKLCESIVSPPTLNNPAVMHGKKYEQIAVQAFMDKTKKTVIPCGLFVCEEFPFLAASPDGLVEKDYVLEVKCPFRGFGKIVTADSSFPFLQLDETDGHLHLKKNSHYWLQVQGQLGITGRKYCYFVVYTGVDTFVDVVEFSEEYWSVCVVPRLKLFYNKHLRPYIASSM